MDLLNWGALENEGHTLYTVTRVCMTDSHDVYDLYDLYVQEHGSVRSAAIPLHAGQQGCHGDASLVQRGVSPRANERTCESKRPPIRAPLGVRVGGRVGSASDTAI